MHRHNQSPAWGQRLIEYGYARSLVLRSLLSGRNPLTVIRSYDADGRGMDFWHDVRDRVTTETQRHRVGGELPPRD